MTDVGTVVIAGAGLAGAKAAEALRKDGFDGRVLLFGTEARRPYIRPPLSKEYLRGEEELDKVFVHPEAWYGEQRVELQLSTTVAAIDAGAHAVVLDDGRRVAFDRLLIATGSEPRRLDVPGGALGGIRYLRTLDDADGLRSAAAGASRVVVIGGGWIGAEVAASIRQLGREVTLVADTAVPLERVVGREVGAIFAETHVANGVRLVANQRVVAFHGRGDVVEAVETADGTRIDADLVVVGIGAMPRTALAEEAGLAVDNGILVSDRLETSADGIFAAGDVASAQHPVFGTRLRVEHWDNARRQGRIAARNMLGHDEAYARIPYFYSDQFDLSLEYAGFAPTFDEVVFRGDPADRKFLAFWLHEGRVVAGMNVNTHKVNETISALVASGRTVEAASLADPGVSLESLAGIEAKAAAG
ncbi:MAG TPA: FAD-dependent oxidoreductase [Candidatus Limnocylindrales bacterium]